MLVRRFFTTPRLFSPVYFQRAVKYFKNYLSKLQYNLHYIQNLYKQSNKVVTLIEGDGIGPELMDSVVGVFAAAEAPVSWERFSTRGVLNF